MCIRVEYIQFQKGHLRSQRNLPQLQYCASKLRNFTDFENLSI
jgi:hypothetical protein